MKENILISIIVPVYNVESYIKKCVSSIIQQTYTNLQVILVDDGSTDQSGEICDSFAEKDERIYVIHQKNSGPVCARKAGLKRAKGKYIGFVDSDDYIEENMFEILLENMIETDADFVHSGYYVNQKREMCFETRLIELRSRSRKERFLREYMLDHTSEKKISPSIWSKLFKAQLIKNSYEMIPDGQCVGEDWIALTECVIRSERISLLNTANYHYVVRDNSLSHLRDVKDLLWQSGLYIAMGDVLKRYGCYEIEKRWLDNAFKSLLFFSLRRSMNYDFAMTSYLFRDVQKILGKNIVLYGAGAVGTSYYAQLCRYPECRIVAWLDSCYEKFHYDCREVQGKDALRELEYDYIILGVKRREAAMDIGEMLKKEGVEPSKILWSAPVDLCSI